MRSRIPPHADPDETLLWEPPHGRPPAPAPAPAGRRRWVRVAKWVLAPFAAYYVLCVLMLVAYRFVSPPTTGVRIERRIESWFADGEYRLRHRPVPLASLPRHVPRAVVAAEDGRFHEHWGFDFGAMTAAGKEAAGGVRMRGASTLTQQLMKNLFGCTCRNPIRKAYDLALTPAAELILGKERILELYLNNVEWGHGVFGIEEGARDRYDVPARRLTRTQAAGLAALLPNPRTRTLQSTAEYRREIVRRMRFRGW